MNRDRWLEFCLWMVAPWVGFAILLAVFFVGFFAREAFR